MLMRIKDIAALIESIAPLPLQEDYDNAGLQVGDPEQEVTGVVLSLDVTEETVRVAKEQGANLIVSHHPLLFRGTKQINPRRDYISRVVIEAIKGDIAIYSAHTNLDNAPMGVNRKISEVLGLTDVRPLAALSARQTAGLSADVARQCGSGMVGELPEALSVEAFVRKVKELFHIEALMSNGVDFDPQRPIRKVAVCGGAGDDLIPDAVRKGADAFLTGEVSYHLYFGHPEVLILCGGHFETEQFTCQLLQDLIHAKYPALPITIGPKSSPVAVY